MTDDRRSLPALLTELVEGDTSANTWLLQALASLSPEMLDRLEAQALQTIDRRYPDNPSSLFNLRYLKGRQRRAQVEALFDEAHLRLTTQQVVALDAMRQQTLQYQLDQVSDELYRQRRAALRQRRADEMDATIAASLAQDHELQRQLSLEEQAHQHRQAEARQAHELAEAQLKVTADLEQARRRLEQPQELLKSLYDLLISLVKYQMSLNDRAMRNPALADRLRMMSMGLTSVMASVQSLIAELNRQSDQTLEPERVREQSEQLLSMAMEQMQQWQDQTQQEQEL